MIVPTLAENFCVVEASPRRVNSRGCGRRGGQVVPSLRVASQVARVVVRGWNPVGRYLATAATRAFEPGGYSTRFEVRGAREPAPGGER
jgi:hypothetical protein